MVNSVSSSHGQWAELAALRAQRLENQAAQSGGAPGVGVGAGAAPLPGALLPGPSTATRSLGGSTSNIGAQLQSRLSEIASTSPAASKTAAQSAYTAPAASDKSAATNATSIVT
jgi:hypothetical protein